MKHTVWVYTCLKWSNLGRTQENEHMLTYVGISNQDLYVPELPQSALALDLPTV